MRSDRATRKLLAIVSAAGVVAGLCLTSGEAVASPASGPRTQALVTITGTTAVTAPGIKVETVLPAIHVELVDGDAAALAALERTPGVLGVEPNVAVHLDGAGWGGDHRDGNDHDNAKSDHGNGNNGNGNDGNNGKGNGNDGNGGGASSASDEGVLAPTTVGGAAGTPSAGRGVTVALIDTGVTDTEALNRASGRLVDAVDTSGLNSDNGRIVEHGVFDDEFGHGTFMASLIAGGAAQGSGDTTLGVAPGATVDVVKVADDQGNTSLGAVLAGLNWVATHANQVDIANLSLSVDRPSNSYGIDPLTLAVGLTRAAGVTVVVAAGNTPGVVGDPGFAPESLTVGAADTSGSKPAIASFSGYGNVDGIAKPDVVAAGVNVLGEMPADSVIAQQYADARQPSGLFRGSGTSQATAIVSGVAALYKSAHRGASPLEVKSAIRDAATDLHAGPAQGQGLAQIPTASHYSNRDTGEQSLQVGAWLSTADDWGFFWFEISPASRSWASRGWANDDWGSRSWASRSWASRAWASRAWASRSWADNDWASRAWASRAWASRAWASRAWAASNWDSRAWASRAWASRAWASRAWASRAWAVASWGG